MRGPSELDGATPEVVLRQAGSGGFRLVREIRYQHPDLGTITVPGDQDRFVTDLASSPWFTSFLVPALGAHLPAVVLHDALVGEADEPTYRTRDGHHIGRATADRVFNDALRATGTPAVQRLIMWSAATVAGAGGIRFGSWVVLVLGVSFLHAAEVVDAVGVLPWIGERTFLLEWAVAAAATSLLLAVVGPLVLGLHRTRAAAVQAVVVGLVFVPALAMLPAKVLLDWVPRFVLRR